MHIVAAAVDAPLDTVLTANASREQVHHALARMEPVSALSAPGPARVATVELSTGHRVALVFHEQKNFIEILAPVASGMESELAEILADLDIAPDAVTWTHERIDLQTVLARLTAIPHR